MNERGFLPSTSIAVILLLRKLHLPHIRSLHTLSVRTQWCLRILYCFEVEFYVALTRVCSMPAGGSSFLQARNSYYILYATFQLRIAAAKSWWGRRHYDCIVCPSVTSEPRRRVEDGVAYTLKHIFKCIGKNGMGNIFFFQYFYSLSKQHVKAASFLNQLFVYGCKQVNVYISDIHWSSNRPKTYLCTSKQYIHIKSDGISYALV